MQRERRESVLEAAAVLQSFLRGIDYPADKEQLKETAEANDAPDNVIRLIDRLPDRKYDYPTDVQMEVSNVT
jgi:hypothetical protein